MFGREDAILHFINREMSLVGLWVLLVEFGNMFLGSSSILGRNPKVISSSITLLIYQVL